jgi:hypothetical protein
VIIQGPWNLNKLVFKKSAFTVPMEPKLELHVLFGTSSQILKVHIKMTVPREQHVLSGNLV